MTARSPSRVLILDDDPFFRRVVADYLGSQGFEPLAVGTVPEAERVLDDGDLAVALVDVFLDDGDAFEFARTVHAASPDTAILLMTARPEGFALSDGAGPLVDDFFVKGNDLAELRRRVSARVEQSDALRSARARARALAAVVSMAQTLGRVTEVDELARTAAPLLLDLPGVRGARIVLDTDDGPVDWLATGAAPSYPPSPLDHASFVEDGDRVEVVPFPGPRRGHLVLRFTASAPVDADVLETLAGVLGTSVAMAAQIEALRERQVRLELGYVQRQRQLAQMSARTERLTDARDSMLALLSHDLRTPLAVILGHCQLLEEGVSQPDQLARGVDVIRRQGQRMSKMVEDLLDRYRNAEGERAARVGDLADIAREMAANFEPVAARRDVHIAVGSLPVARVEADLAELREVVANVLENALRHAPAGTSVDLDLGVGDEAVELVVRDRGPGFAQTSETPSGGSGLRLGTRAVQRMVAHAGGTVAFGDHPDGGARVCITLPLAVTVSEDAWVLLCGADREQVEPINELLTASWSVGVASSPMELRHRARRTPPLGVVLDLHDASAEGGAEWLAALKAEDALAAVPVIAIVPHGADVVAAGLVRAGALRVLRRPLDAQRLLGAVRSAARLVANAATSSLGRAVDPLTRLDTVTYARARLERLVQEHRAAGMPLPTLLVQALALDDVGNAWGAAVADQFLVWVAGQLRERAHPGDLLARVDESNFVLVCPARELPPVERMAAELAESAARARPRLGVARVHVRLQARAIDAAAPGGEVLLWGSSDR